MTLIFLAGLLSTGGLTALVVAYQRAPRHVRCPQCGEPTEGVLPHRLIRRAAPRMRVRWCAACSWEGWGRQGPDYVHGRPVAHDSGFHWGADRWPADSGFVWNRPPEKPPAEEPPHHPSGFRFGSDRPRPPRPRASSFHWKGRRKRRRRQPEFRWREGAQ